MSSNIHEHLIALATKHGLPPGVERPMEFFFYADDDDSAANLSIALHQLGYRLYEARADLPVEYPLCICGHTPMISTSPEVLAAWYDEMAALAESLGCNFDGYGTLITEPEEGWDAIM